MNTIQLLAFLIPAVLAYSLLWMFYWMIVRPSLLQVLKYRLGSIRRDAEQLEDVEGHDERCCRALQGWTFTAEYSLRTMGVSDLRWAPAAGVPAAIRAEMGLLEMRDPAIRALLDRLLQCVAAGIALNSPGVWMMPVSWWVKAPAKAPQRSWPMGLLWATFWKPSDLPMHQFLPEEVVGIWLAYKHDYQD